MKRVLLPLFICISLLAQSQALYNEWIDYNKTYYKFKVPATGFYRINQSALSGIGLGSTPAEQFQLWRNGQQIPIYTSVQTGAMGPSDYIEFWGEMNDGKPDKDLYRITDHQINDKWSLESDTAIYFLTVNSGTNLRLTPVSNGMPTSMTPDPFFLYTTGTYYREKYHLGYAAIVGDYVYSSDYENGEGFTSNDIGTGVTKTASYSNLKPYTGAGAPAPVVRLTATGNALNPRQFVVRLGGTLIGTTTMDYFDYVKTNYTAAISNISSGSANLDVTNNCAVANDRMVIGQSELIYPRLFDFNASNNFYFELPANPNGNYLEITNFNYGASAPILYDLSNGRRYICDIANPPMVRVVLQPSTIDRRLVLVTSDPSNRVAITNFQQRNFINYAVSANQGNYLIISHQQFTTSSTGLNPLTEYSNFRNSAAGGSYNAKIYMIDQLIDQFAYGIKQHPLSIRNFLRFARGNFASPVKAAFIIGKGLQYIHNRVLESNPNLALLSFVPTFGYPASDNLLAANPGLDVIPKTPIGRLSVINGDEVMIYLNKVKQYEQAQAFQSPFIRDKAWNKNIVHVIGAGDGALGDQLTLAMNGFKSIVADTFYGANVNTFSKLSSAPVEQTNITRLYGLFEEGTGLLTYFGHSSASTLEFNLDNPDAYNNQGKYPLFILLGCNAGNFYNYNLARLQTKETISEKFVLADQRGSIATVASTGLGIVYYLDILNGRMMNAMSNTRYGKTLGEIMIQAATETFALTTQQDYYARFHVEQSTLHGDPVLKMDIAGDKPDYVIEDPMVQIEPTFISVASTNFTVRAKFMNLSKAISKPVVIEFKRTYPDLTTFIRRDTIPGIRYMDSLTYTIPIVGNKDKGTNKITITIDPDNITSEVYESNNTVTKDFFIYEDEARPVFPYNLSIVNSQNIKFKASTANPFDVVRQYRMEVDTTQLFNSAIKVTQDISTSGGVMEFNPVITFLDSTVYYWRVAPVASTNQIWNNASFVYLPLAGKGFNQSHYFQHLLSKQDRISIKPNRKWSFDTTYQNLFARNTIFPEGGTQQSEFTISINNNPLIGGGCYFNAIILNVFDPVTLAPWQNNYSATGGLYESLLDNCGPRREFNFEYSFYDTAGRRKMMNFLNNVVPNGFYVVARANIPSTTPVPAAYPDVWRADTAYYGSGNSLYHVFKNQGFVILDSFNAPKTWIFAYRKNGQPGFRPLYTMAQTIFDKLTLNIDVRTPSPAGIITSPLYGPAKNWKFVYTKGTALPDVGVDSTALDIIGVDNSGLETTLFQGLNPDQLSFDISSIDPNSYPFLKLKLFTRDSINLTSYQLKYWEVTYDPVPEGAIAPNIFFSGKDTADLGEPVNYKIAFKNISEVPFDSLKVKLMITDRNNVQFIVPIPRRRPLPVNDTLQLGAVINTISLAGNNSIFLEANPDNDQKEQYHFNNFAFRSLYVRPDSLNPLLDVTFDGVHILNRDIVSSKPNIIVKLKDEARWMILDDTSLLTLRVRYPNGTIRRFYFSNDTLRFIPAGQAPNPDNTATINFNPYFLTDGEYELMITGKDKSNNSAGALEYRVIFEVINKPMISNMLNYPNPFTTSTAFVFTITGSEVPQNIKIEIMTITGRIVREITKDELGPLHIGRNITEFKWDGTDQYGQKLANGVYLYRVITNLNGMSLDKYKADGDKTDKYFNKGYGKMYLMR